MSYFFSILSPNDKPLFTHVFGTSKGGGDGQPHFNHRTFSSAAIANLAASTNPLTSPTSPSSTPSNPASATVQYMNQFLVHASLDIVEEVQWTSSAMYLKTIDTYPPTNAHIFCWLAGSNVRFLLLYQPNAITAPGAATPSSLSAAAMASSTSASLSSASLAGSVGATGRGGMSPGSQQMEEAVKGFMTEVFESWVKCHMNPFFRIGMEIRSPVFRQRVGAAGRKWL